MTADPGASAGPCTLERHRAEVAVLLAPLVDRLAHGPGEELGLADPHAAGRVLARAYRALASIPAFDNSQMDGYAVRAEDLATASGEHPVTLPIGVATAAGDPPVAHAVGTASPIMTGAAIPAGADAVVPIEDAVPAEFPRLSRAGGPEPEGLVSFRGPVGPGRFIRPRGEDTSKGDPVAAAGARLTATRIGALVAAGIARVSVRPRPRVLLCSTGDELSPAGAALRPGRIHDANTPMLRAAIGGLGAEVTVLRCGDTPGELQAALREALGIDGGEAHGGGDDGSGADAASVDLIVTSGGISRGAFEVVREALAPLGADFHSVALQPGGPQGLGALRFSAGADPIPVLCFPGNPVSAALSCELFLAPALRALAGLPAEREIRRLPLARDVESPAGKHQIRRATLDVEGRVEVLAPGSHLLGDLAAAELLVHLPVGVAHAPAGSDVETWRFND